MHKLKNNSKNDQHLNFYGLKLQVKKSQRQAQPDAQD